MEYAAAREHRMKDLEDRLRFVELRPKGKSLSTIGKEIGVSRQTLANWQREHEEEIENLRAMELDSLAEEYWMTEEARIELIGEELRRVRDELKKRDFSETPTAKLFEMELRLSNELTEHFSKPSILTDTQVARRMQIRDTPGPRYPDPFNLLPEEPLPEKRTPLSELQKGGNGEKGNHKSGKKVHSAHAAQTGIN